MAHAYTPGLKVTEQATVRKMRRLPILGEVLVAEGKEVTPEMVVARAQLPGNPHTVNVANSLSVEPEDVPHFMVRKVGDKVGKGEVIATYRAFFGLMKNNVTSPVEGVIENISAVTGQVVVREPAIPVQVDAYIKGKITQVMPREGVIVETRGAFIQGIFGVGGERQGRLKMLAKTPDDILDEKDITPEGKDQIVIGGSLVTGKAIKKAMEYGVKGIVAGGIIDKDLVEILGYDIGVAITGHEDIPLTIVITEGFGKIRMAEKTFHLLKELSGQTASINGATQIRAGVMRPEIIVAGYVPKTVAAETKISEGLIPGTPIRIIREPFFGELAEVVDLPPELQTIETEAHVRILKARLTDGREVTIPRANVEILEE